MSELKEPILFEKGHPASDFLLEWWDGLKQNKGDRAELRRCKNLKEIQMASAYQRCYWQLIKHFAQESQGPSKEQMAIIIGLAAYIEENETTYIERQSKKEQKYYIGFQMAESKGKEEGTPPKLSELRFRRLLKIRDREKLYRFLIQTIRLLDKKVNLLDLLSIAYFWGDPKKTRLAYKYYEKANLETK